MPRSVEGIRMWIQGAEPEHGRTLEHANEEVRTLLDELDRANARADALLTLKLQAEEYREKTKADLATLRELVSAQERFLDVRARTAGTEPERALAADVASDLRKALLEAAKGGTP